MSSQLFSRAEKMAASGECSREMIEVEAAKLKAAVHQFAARLDERREIILHAFEFYQKTETVSCSFVPRVSSQWKNICLHVSHSGRKVDNELASFSGHIV